MKKIICVLVIAIVLILVGFYFYPKAKPEVVEGDISNIENEADVKTVLEEETEDKVDNKLSNEEMYSKVIDDYKNASKEIDLEDFDSIEKAGSKYELVNTLLIEHVKRYSEQGVALTYEYYDIDKNGVDELIMGASGAPGAIYSYDKNDSKAVKIFFQDTMERGDLSIYDNGVILSSGAGGAMLHIYEFGKISEEDTAYTILEKVEEEYEEGKEVPTYKDASTNKVLSYKSYDELVEKYLENASKVELKDYQEVK